MNVNELDPQTQAIARENRVRWVAPFQEATIARARAAYTERYSERSLPPAGDVHIEQLEVACPEGPIRARLYRPPQTDTGAAPLLVYFHGGGFVLGDADTYELQSMRLAEKVRCAVLFPEFRLAPEHAFPAAVHDAIAAVEWAVRQAHRLDIDPSRLAVAGDSAGGNLAVNVCLAARDRGFARIAFQCLLYPLTDFRPYCAGPSYASVEEFSAGYLLDRAVMEWFARSYLPDSRAASDPRASPILATDLSGLPPTAVVTAGCDPLRDMGAQFARMLADAGTSVEYHCMEHLAHNFMGHVARSARARRAFDLVVDLLRRHLQPPG